MTGSKALEMPRQRTGRRNSSPEPTQKVQSLILRLLVYGAAIFTFAVLAFLIGYILVKGIPYLTPDLFSWTYNSTNCSMLPSIITTGGDDAAVAAHRHSDQRVHRGLSGRVRKEGQQAGGSDAPDRRDPVRASRPLCTACSVCCSLSPSCTGSCRCCPAR